MGTCNVAGLWNQVHGVGPFLSEQEFMAENINLLCQLLSVTPGVGGLSGVTVGAGFPPVPGTVITLFYKDTNTGFKYMNLGTVLAPDWDIT